MSDNPVIPPAMVADISNDAVKKEAQKTIIPEIEGCTGIFATCPHSANSSGRKCKCGKEKRF